MTTNMKEIMEKLNHIQQDLDFVKSHLADVDLVLTEDDQELITQAKKDLQQGNTRLI